MTLDPHKLDSAIEALHRTLDNHPAVDDESRTQVRDAVTEVSSEGGGHHRLEELAVSFEADHPALAASLRQIVDVLGKGGL